MNLYVLSYNNYYNRIVKKEGNFQSYAPFVIYGPVQGVYGFTPGDGVNTVQLLGSNVQMYNGEGDYLLAVNEYGEIDSRWFIIDTKRERNGQWTLTLHRDLIVDFYEKILESPMFIEKAILPEDNPLIFNKEDMTVNQIFTDQLKLQDQTECGWFVGYYAKNAPTMTGTVMTNDLAAVTYEVLDNINQLTQYTEDNPYKGELNSLLLKTRTPTTEMLPTGATIKRWYTQSYDLVSGSYSAGIESGGSVTDTGLELSNGSGWDGKYINACEGLKDELMNSFKGSLNWHSADETNLFLNYNNKTVLANGTYYDVTVLPLTEKHVELTNVLNQNPNLFAYMKNVAATAGYTGTPNGHAFIASGTTPQYYVSVSERTDLNVTYTIPDTGKLTTTNEPYDIFAIPYGDLTIIDTTDNTSIQTTKDIGIQTISSILGTYGEVTETGSRIYDVQLIGYCPVQFLITNNKEITVDDVRQRTYVTTGEGENIVRRGVIFHLPSSSFSFNIPINIPSVSKKMETQCDSYRLIAPDQSSYFDFDIAKNNGLTHINVDVNLKPYNCYIHANPDFKLLYGKDFNTARGLIYGSNISLSRALNAFTEYQIQNSQFQNIFDRQVQNMEVQHRVGRIQDFVGGITGTASGAAGGALAGSIIPGIGTLAGAAVGGITSGVGGIADYAINEMLRNEAIDYTKDQFGYQLENIRKQPNTLSKVTALTQNNTLFIAIEYYTCTPEEKRAFANKIAYNSMTVMTIGKIEDYIGNEWEYNGIKSKGYIKGKLINLSGTNDDYHVINSLANELYKGVYFTWE